MNLKQLIEYLEKKDPGIVVPIGFADPHSYRGDYNCLGLEPRKNVTVGDMLVSVRDALGNVYQGWKGGEYRMGESTEVYLAMEGSSGEKIGTVLLDYMTGVYDGEHIGRCNDSVKSLTTANVNLESALASAEDILSMATNEIRDIEVGNLKTINSLLRANIENMNKEKVQVGRAIKELCGEIEYLNDSIRGLEDELASAARSSLDYSASIFNRDSIIEGKNVTISHLGNRIDDQENKLKKGYEDITSLKVEVNRLRDILRNEHDYNTDLLESIRLKCHKIVALESKLSVCKEDSVVLKKVVDVIKDDTIANIRVPCMICSIVDDYLDASEESEEKE